MYDTVNSYQVKCFECNMNYYINGDKMPTDEYGENYIILEEHVYDNEYWGYTYVIHIVQNGILIESVEECSYGIDWGKVENVVTEDGTLLNVNSSSDIEQYLKDMLEYHIKYKELHRIGDNLRRKLYEKRNLLDENEKEILFKKIEDQIKIEQKEHDKIVELISKWYK